MSMRELYVVSMSVQIIIKEMDSQEKVHTLATEWNLESLSMEHLVQLIGSLVI
jgi:hypothetical protein